MWHFHDEHPVGGENVLDASGKVLKVVDMRDDVVREHGAGRTPPVAYSTGELLGKEFVPRLQSARVGQGRKVCGRLDAQRMKSARLQRAKQDPDVTPDLDDKRTRWREPVGYLVRVLDKVLDHRLGRR